jgi:outer membrane protein TolC
MKTSTWRILLVLFLILPSLEDALAQNKLTLDQAVQLAENRSMQLVASDAMVNASHNMAIAAGQLPDPILKMGVNNLPVNGPDNFSLTQDFMTMRSVGVMQEFTREDKRLARGMRFEAEAEVAQVNRSLISASIERSAAAAWLDRYYQERFVTLWQRQLAEAQLQVDAADTAYRSGHGSQANVFAARTAQAQAEDRLAQAERQLTTAKTQLARWIGDTGGQELSELPAMDTLAFDDTNVDTHLLNHPQIVLMRKQEDLAQAEVAIARANQSADWSVELMYNQRGPAYSNMVSINASVPLQWDQKNRQNRELAAKLAAADALSAEREEAMRTHTNEVIAMLQEWHSNRDRIQRYETSILPLTVQRTQATLTAYRGGTQANLSAVLEARRAEVDLNLDYLRLEMDTARLWVQLNYLTPGGK